MAKIPEPEETGSDGKQETSTIDVVEVEPQSPLTGLPIVESLEGLAAEYPRSMGGQVGANLVVGSFRQLSKDLEDTK